MLNINDPGKKRKEQIRRWNALGAGHGNRAGTGIFPGTRQNVKITPDQLIELQKLQDLGWTNKPIRTKLDLSEYIVKMALRGHYNHILPPDLLK